MIIFSQDTNDISGERLNSSISKIKNIKLLLKIKEDELSRKTLEAKELAAQLYDDKQTIAILEDRLRDLNFSLHQKNTELASIKTMAAVRSDGQDREIADLNEKVWLIHQHLENKYCKNKSEKLPRKNDNTNQHYLVHSALIIGKTLKPRLDE